MEENDIGRALEAIVVTTIAAHAHGEGLVVRFTSRAAKDNARDLKNAKQLSKGGESDFKRCGKAVCAWLDKQGFFCGAKSLVIDRLPDSSGVAGNVTDFVLSFAYAGGKNANFNFSLKNTHDALKHPRLTRFPKICGVTDAQELAAYKENHDAIWSEFFKQVRKRYPRAKLVREMLAVDPGFVEDNLYVPFNALIKDFLDDHAKDPGFVSTLFSFLATSNLDYIGIKNEKGKIIVKHFDGIRLPRSLSTRYKPNNKTTFFVEFDNGWVVSFRLHTASSRLYSKKKSAPNKSVKFDVQPVNLSDVIHVEELSK